MYDFIPIDEGDLIEAGIEAYEKETEDYLFAGDERRFMINSFAYMILLACRECNYGINQMFTTTAEEDGLTIKGKDFDVNRLPAERAVVNVQFLLEPGRTSELSIPVGTRVTYDGLHFYKTEKTVVADIGQESVCIDCVATETGSGGYNGVAIGAITTLVDNVSGVASVSNIDSPAGGAEIEDIESWRERISLKERGCNTAGSRESYLYHIKSADSSVGSVKVITDDDAVVKAIVLCKDGSIPNEHLLSKILDYVSTEDKIPLTDKFEVLSPNIVEYDIDFSYTISPDNLNRIEEIKSSVAKAVDLFREEVGLKIGTDINPDLLRKYLFNAGASTILVTSPGYIEVNDLSVGKCSGSCEITYSGLR